MIVVIILSAFYAYNVNARRASDDPEKRDYSHYAIWVIPVVLPILVLFNVLTLILSTISFGLILLLFPFALLLFRKPFLIKWILTLAQRIGNKVLKVNTALLRMAGFYPAPTIKLQIER
jgi:hypothetical protein